MTLVIRYILIGVLLLVNGCRQAEQQEPSGPASAPVASQPQAPRKAGCRGCHAKVTLGAHDQLTCTDCHQGHDHTGDRQQAHRGLIARPAHPDHMAAICGRCHAKEVRAAANSLHFTLKKAVNLVRAQFGADKPVKDLRAIPQGPQPPSTPQELADDMLRRRCLRCHPFSAGDDYPFTHRGTGCAACHVAYRDGKLLRHGMLARPTDEQCMSCHYGNRVGADYYGQFEHDYNWEYRTPYATHAEFARPYGVEQHDLVPDIHEQQGLTCLDCHQGRGLMGFAHTGITCRSCHAWRPGRPLPDLAGITAEQDKLFITPIYGKEKIKITPMRNQAHDRFGDQVDCQVCHAQWSFNDTTSHLLLSDLEDVDEWERLTVQSSSEVEHFLDHNLSDPDEEWTPAMRDGITGHKRSGIWYKGFTERRWARLVIRRDAHGIIRVFRPLLRLRLSRVTSDDTAPFDNLTGTNGGLLPYTPHTTGHAGLFYLHRFQHLLTDKNN